MLKLSGLLLLSAALGEGYAISRRDDPSPEVRRALEDAGVDVNLRVAKPKNVCPVFPSKLCTLNEETW
jgi:hypothetical protein